MEFPDKLAFDRAFKKRLVETRLELDYSHRQMADELGIKEAAYQKYETRPGSLFPLYLLHRLVSFTEKPYSYWCTGMIGMRPPLKVITRR